MATLNAPHPGGANPPTAADLRRQLRQTIRLMIAEFGYDQTRQALDFLNLDDWIDSRGTRHAPL